MHNAQRRTRQHVAGAGPAREATPGRARQEQPVAHRRWSGRRQGDSADAETPAPRFTHRQGQFLAFIHLYRRLHRRGPAEADLGLYFGLTPPSVHATVARLRELGLVAGEPGVARSLRVGVPDEQVPALEEVPGPPW